MGIRTISDNVIRSQTDEAHHRKPDSDNFRENFAGGDGEKYGHTDEPIACVIS